MDIRFPEGFTLPQRLAGLPDDTAVLLAFSGGSDSSALLSLLAASSRVYGFRLYAAHVDHLIRPDEHQRDRDFCEKTAARYGIRLFTLTADVPAAARESGESLELAARRIRYGFFEKIMRENDIPLLATAHNSDDNLETLILNLLRGSGLRGMCGIPPCRSFGTGFLVRPVLGMSKQEINAYCEENSVEYVTDSTNFIADCSRNRVRLDIIPELKKLNPEAGKTAARLCRSLRGDAELIDGITERFIAANADSNSVGIAALAAQPAALRYRVFARFCPELETVHAEALGRLCEKNAEGSSVSLPGSITATVIGNRLVFSSGEDSPLPPPCSCVLKDGENDLKNGMYLTLSGVKENIYKSEIHAAIASDKINGELSVRGRSAGDRIFLRGMNRSVKKLMCDKKVPRPLRDALPVVCDGEGIVFVPYLGVCDRLVPVKCDKTTYIGLNTGYNNGKEHYEQGH